MVRRTRTRRQRHRRAGDSAPTRDDADVPGEGR